MNDEETAEEAERVGRATEAEKALKAGKGGMAQKAENGEDVEKVEKTEKAGRCLVYTMTDLDRTSNLRIPVPRTTRNPLEFKKYLQKKAKSIIGHDKSQKLRACIWLQNLLFIPSSSSSYEFC